MSYTHYYELNADLTDEVIRDVEKVLQKYPDLVINFDSTLPPEVSKRAICFNGFGESGHETFYVAPYYSGFCKTAYKPYDLAVCEVLLILKHHYKDAFELSSDGFYVGFEQFERKELGGYWNIALENVEREFGYTFTLKGITEEHNGYTYYSFEIY